MPHPPTPIETRTKDDVRAFFDAFAAHNREQHGAPASLLQRRIDVLDRYAGFQPDDVVLDVGCGDGKHLRALAPRIRRGIGVDLSPRMIETARRTGRDGLDFRVDDAEVLATVPDASVDVVICCGVLEHLLHPGDAFTAIRRVLRPGGRLAGLTLNGHYWWYRLADRLGIPTRHLTTDTRLPPDTARQMLDARHFEATVDYWSFVPRGDLYRPLSWLCSALDALGRHVAPSRLRGGLVVSGRARSRPAPEPVAVTADDVSPDADGASDGVAASA